MRAWRKHKGKCWKKNSPAIDVIFDWNTWTFIAVRDRLHMIVRALKLSKGR